MRLDACGRLDLAPLHGHWYRALRLKFWDNRLSVDHSRTSPTRFNPGTPEAPAYRILYLGETHQVVMYEVGALFGTHHDPVPRAEMSVVVMSLGVDLRRVADLCDRGQQSLLGVSEGDLTRPWDETTDPDPTQRLGAALEATPGLEGFIYPSANPPGRNLAVFPDKLDPASTIRFLNELTGEVESFG